LFFFQDKKVVGEEEQPLAVKNVQDDDKEFQEDERRIIELLTMLSSKYNSSELKLKKLLKCYFLSSKFYQTKENHLKQQTSN
jgi:hypothetical protein